MVLPNLNGPLARLRLGRLLHRLQLRRDGTPSNFLLTSFTSSARVRVAGMKLRPTSKPESAAEGEFAAKAMRKLPEDLAEAMAAARAVAD